MKTEKYTAEEIRTAVEKEADRLFAPWMVGREDGWKTDIRTKDLICIGFWLMEELTRLGVNDDDRRTQQSFFNRWSRSDDDLYDLAARTMNAVFDGAVEQNRKPHRRWG